jgi:hypothetical protein
METLIEQLQTELDIPQKEAVELVKAITEYVEKQHPLLKDLAQDLFTKELSKTKSV